MSDISDLLGGQYLSAENVPQPLLVTIAGADRAELDNQPRLVVKFAELQKGLLANKTNLGMLSQLFGKDTTRWVGQRVVLLAEPVSFQGRMVQGLRIKPAQGSPAPQVTSMHQPPQSLAALTRQMASAQQHQPIVSAQQLPVAPAAFQ